MAYNFVNGLQVDGKDVATKEYVDDSALFEKGSDSAETSIQQMGNTATGIGSFATGSLTQAKGTYSHTEGLSTNAEGQRSHAEGSYSLAYADDSHAEGSSSQAYAKSSHAEGSKTYAAGAQSHAEGEGPAWLSGSLLLNSRQGTSTNPYVYSYLMAPSGITVGAVFATSDSSTANRIYFVRITEIDTTNKIVKFTCAENVPVSLLTTLYPKQGIAYGQSSHSEGANTVASGDQSHAEGNSTIAGYAVQHVSGKFNDNKSTTLLEVGNGTADNARSNAFEVHADGHAEVGAMGSTANSVATKTYVDSKCEEVTSTDLLLESNTGTDVAPTLAQLDDTDIHARTYTRKIGSMVDYVAIINIYDLSQSAFTGFQKNRWYALALPMKVAGADEPYNDSTGRYDVHLSVIGGQNLGNNGFMYKIVRDPSDDYLNYLVFSPDADIPGGGSSVAYGVSIHIAGVVVA